MTELFANNIKRLKRAKTLLREEFFCLRFLSINTTLVLLEQKNTSLSEVIIAKTTPQFLERGVLWFTENERQIKTALASKKEPWAELAVLYETGTAISPQILTRKLFDLGYEKTGFIFGRGEYAARGNIVEIAPINRDDKIIFEFYGNIIESISVSPLERTQKAKYRKEEVYAPDDYVVHLDHGIGIFRGKIRLSGTEEPFFAIEYAPPRKEAKPDMLYVPLSQKNRLARYIGFETPAIHRLGGSVWFTARKKAREEIERFAKELLELYKRRAQSSCLPLYEIPDLEARFASLFPHQETQSQIRAIADIFNDMEKSKPMDRLLVGDVGFGKTEVALRAAMRAIANSRLVLMLAPTTVLAEEHFKTALERFGDLPVNIQVLTRLASKPEAQKIVNNFSNGKIDLLIGTHRLLSKDLTAALDERIGLMIIDEEQRFGVKQKEKIKNIRPNIHLLSLSATPIPRTLSLALAKLRDLSIINTPPPKRLPIKTFVAPYNENFIKKALEHELTRKGQIFFVHNRIATLALFKQKLQRLAPRAAIACIHSKTPPREIVRVLKDFRAGEIDILAATTIIENGIDFPNANTVIVEDATRIGLASAHQLRGRIGRGNAQSYAYFLYRPQNLTEQARERLGALEEFSYLGAGQEIALKDMEIRGAGNVLGREQSGTANKIGLNLYFQMLSEIIEREI